MHYATGDTPSTVAEGDFNGDGRMDLVTANYSTNNLSVLLGNGNGTFHNAVNYAVGTNPYSVAVGDFNGDGRPDLAVSNQGSGNVSVLLATPTEPSSSGELRAGTEPAASLLRISIRMARIMPTPAEQRQCIARQGDGTFQRR